MTRRCSPAHLFLLSPHRFGIWVSSPADVRHMAAVAADSLERSLEVLQSVRALPRRCGEFVGNARMMLTSKSAVGPANPGPPAL